MSWKDYGLDRLQQRVVEITHMIHALTDVPDDVDGLVCDTHISIHIPFNPAELRRVRKALGKKWKRAYRTEYDDGEHAVVFKHKGNGAKLIVWMNPDKPNSTCHRVQVGVKEVPVYKVVCE